MAGIREVVYVDHPDKNTDNRYNLHAEKNVTK